MSPCPCSCCCPELGGVGGTEGPWCAMQVEVLPLQERTVPCAPSWALQVPLASCLSVWLPLPSPGGW